MTHTKNQKFNEKHADERTGNFFITEAFDVCPDCLPEALRNLQEVAIIEEVRVKIGGWK